MWNFIKGIFGSGDNVSKGLDMIGKAGDALVFTDEEKSQANFAKFQLMLDWVKSTSAQNVARRIIAFAIVGAWLYILMLMVHFHLLGFIVQAEFLYKVLNDILHWPFVTIIGFYFLAHLTRSLNK